MFATTQIRRMNPDEKKIEWKYEIRKQKKNTVTGARDGSVRALCARKYANHFFVCDVHGINNAKKKINVKKINIGECEKGITFVRWRFNVCRQPTPVYLFRFDWIHWVPFRCSSCDFFGDQKSARKNSHTIIKTLALNANFRWWHLEVLFFFSFVFHHFFGWSEKSKTSEKRVASKAIRWLIRSLKSATKWPRPILCSIKSISNLATNDGST